MLRLSICLLVNVITSTFYVEKPSAVKKMFSYKGFEGAIPYSISTFGNVLYNEKDEIRLFLPESGNEKGCEVPLNIPNLNGDRFFFLIERG